MINSKLERLNASGQLPSPKGIALQVMKLTQKDSVTNQEIVHIIKADPARHSCQTILSTNQQEGTDQHLIKLDCTTTIGVAVFSGHEKNSTDILKWADKAMYQAKEEGAKFDTDIK